MDNSAIEQAKREYFKLIQAKADYYKYNKWELMFPDAGPFKRSLYPKHIAFMDAGATYDERAFIAANRVGKAQPLDALIPTPLGYVTMGEIKPGQLVLGSDGKPTKVVAVYPQGLRPVYEVLFSDQTTIKCDADHLWTVRNTSQGRTCRFKGYRTIKTTDLLKERVALPDRPISYMEESEELAIDPYLLGLLLGDGGLSTNSVIISSHDEEIVDYCRQQAELWETTLKNMDETSYRFITKLRRGGRHFNRLKLALTEYGLMGTNSFTKFIPEPYKYTTYEARLAMLQGLMDTDGYIGENHKSEYCTTSERLANDFLFIARSLGLNPTKKTKLNACGNMTWRIYIPCTDLPIFQLTRKRIKLAAPINTRAIIPNKLTYIGLLDCQCISVEAEDQLYLTEHFLPTHNTTTGAYELTCHMTGIYPKWWKGRRFLTPVDAWCCNKTNEKLREVQQKELLGPDLDDIGTGMVPRHLIVGEPKRKQGATDTVLVFSVRHSSGGISRCEFKSYEQGRDAFEGTKRQVIWLDEEPRDPSIYSECLMRLVDKFNPGTIISTFTPLAGMSEVIRSFLPDGMFPANGIHPTNPWKYVVNVTWDDVPHIPEDEKARKLASIPKHERLARTQGIPTLESGRIYPYAEEDVVVDPIPIPAWWPRAYGFDVGWNCTAAVWAAKNPETGQIFLYSEHYQGETVPAIHASAIKARGAWMIGAIDPASSGRSQIDGKRLIDEYENEELNLVNAEHSIEAGILRVQQMFATGQLKIFSTLTKVIQEFRLYARDEKGKIQKQFDHAMDAMRYLLMTDDIFSIAPQEDTDNYRKSRAMELDQYTGY